MSIVFENASRAHRFSADRLLTHDVRNVFASLQVYSELLSEPGILAAGREHYAGELGVIVERSLRLMEKLEAGAEATGAEEMAAEEKIAPLSLPVQPAGSSGEPDGETPVTNGTYPISNFSELLADANEVRCLQCL